MTRYELVDWSPERCGPIPLPAKWGRHKRREWAFKCNMRIRKVGTIYIHNGRKP